MPKLIKKEKPMTAGYPGSKPQPQKKRRRKDKYEYSSTIIRFETKNRESVVWLRILMAFTLIAIAGLILFGIITVVNEIDFSESGTDASQRANINLEALENEKKLLTVANVQHPLENYKINACTVAGITVDSIMRSDLTALLSDAKDSGIDITLLFGYITKEAQDKKYTDEVERLRSEGKTLVTAEAEAKKSVAKGGMSEYQTGLLIKIDDKGGDFSKSKAYIWLTANASKYGFIKRFPEKKQDLTGMLPDNTVYRYVGRDNAKKTIAYNMCLEEYENYINAR